MAGDHKFEKGIYFVSHIEKLIIQGKKDAILGAVKNSNERNHLVALGSRLKQLLLENKETVIFTKLTFFSFPVRYYVTILTILPPMRFISG